MSKIKIPSTHNALLEICSCLWKTANACSLLS